MQGYTPLGMFRKSDEFYKSMGLAGSEMSYGPKALIVKPRDREVVCHGSAWDFCDREDFRYCYTLAMPWLCPGYATAATPLRERRERGVALIHAVSPFQDQNVHAGDP